MRAIVRACVVAVSVSTSSGVGASDLGTSGPFRSIGGRTCPNATLEGCVPTLDASLPPGRRAEQAIDRALAFLDFLRIDDAKATLDEALRVDPDNVRALTLRGRLALTRGRPDEARPDVERAFQLLPRDPDLLITLALLSEPEQAAHDLDEALARRPDDVDGLFARARSRLGRGDLEGALADLNRNLAVEPDDRRARTLRAQVNLRRHAYDLAVADAGRILSSNPRDLQALQVQAAGRAAAGDQAGAVEAYDALIGASPMPPTLLREALIARGRIQAQRRNLPEAKRDLDALMAQRGLQGVLQVQVYLRGHGYPNLEISGDPTTAFETALSACFGDVICGPNLFR